MDGREADQQNVIQVRNAIFVASEGMALEEAMLGTIMAQGKLIASIARDPDDARALVERYTDLLKEGIGAYVEEFTN